MIQKFVPGQLVWCPSDPSLGIGVITRREATQISVRFLSLVEERAYTTRGEVAVARYEISARERVLIKNGRERQTCWCSCTASKTVCSPMNSMMARSLSRVCLCCYIGAKERLATLNLVHPEVVRARLQGLQLASAFGKRPGLAAVLGARVQWLPHQVDVASRAIDQEKVRLLLADEVGLGKTVEAALIYAGLRHEGRANRVVRLNTECLGIQWLGEMFRKTHELLVLLDEERIEDTLRDYAGMNPFEAHQRVVASIDRVARDEILAESAAEASWDLVIVDEAHHLRWRPDGESNPSYRLVQNLAARSTHLLLLTATPMALDPAEYHALLRLLEPLRFDEPTAFETVAKRVETIRDVARAVTSNKMTAESQATALELLADDREDQALFEKFVSTAGGTSPLCVTKAARRLTPAASSRRATTASRTCGCRHNAASISPVSTRKPRILI